MYRPKTQAGMVKFANVWMNNIAHQQDVFNTPPCPDAGEREEAAIVLPQATGAPVTAFGGAEQGSLMLPFGKPARRIAGPDQEEGPEARQGSPPRRSAKPCLPLRPPDRKTPPAPHGSYPALAPH